MEPNEEMNTGGDQEADSCSWMDVPASNSSRAGDKKRRFSEQQIKSLESMFQTQTKLEPRQKLQLAKELNLEPRQVAIWFQNKRARWKSKQLEREYGALKAEYDSLLSSFESLKKEKQLLVKQLQKLAELMEKQGGAGSKDVKYGNGEYMHGKAMELGEETEIRTVQYSEEGEEEREREDKKLVCFSEEEGELHTGQTNHSNLSTFGGLDEQQQLLSLHASSWPPADQLMCNVSTQWWEFWPIKE